MAAERSIEELLTILSKELNCLQIYNRECEKLHRYVVSRDWQKLERTLSVLKGQAETLAGADQQRELLISYLKKEMALPTECSFGLLISRFPAEKTEDINQLKRKIRRNILVLQSRIQGIGRYTDSQTAALKDVLDILIPDQKGKIYNKNGAASSSGNNPMLFSRHI